MRNVTEFDNLRHLAFLLALCVIPGCGAQTYRNRLERTSNYYRYLEKLDENLSTSRWQADGISLRVPKQFNLVSRKQKQNAKGRGGASLIGSPRGISTLEGIVGIWRCTVDVGERDENLDAFIFVASNQHLWNQDGATRQKAAKFEERLIQRIYSALGARMPKKNEWKEKRFPEKNSLGRSGSNESAVFSDRIPFSTFRIEPQSSFLGLKGNYDFLLYTHASDSVQMAVLFVIPEKTVSSEGLSEAKRIGMCLETLRIAGASTGAGSSGGVPRRAAPGGGLDF